MWRKLGGIAAGVVILGGVVMLLQSLGSSLHPLPEGVDPMDPADREAFEAYMRTMPVAAWLLAMASEVVGAFCGAVVAGWITRERRGWVPAVVVGLALAGSVFNWISFTHPVWFVVAQLVAYPAAWLLAVATVRRVVPAPASP